MSKNELSPQQSFTRMPSAQSRLIWHTVEVCAETIVAGFSRRPRSRCYRSTWAYDWSTWSSSWSMGLMEEIEAQSQSQSLFPDETGTIFVQPQFDVTHPLFISDAIGYGTHLCTNYQHTSSWITNGESLADVRIKGTAPYETLSSHFWEKHLPKPHWSTSAKPKHTHTHTRKASSS